MTTLRERILAADLKAAVSRIAEWAAQSPAHFAQLIQLFLHDEYRVVQRAAWAISLVAKTQPALVATHLPAMVQRMNDAGIPTAVKRNVVRVLQFLPVPEALQGAVMEHCFAFLANPEETVAVRAFSMTVLANLAKDYPEIKGEIILLIEDALQQEPTAAIVSRAKKVLKALRQ